MSGSLDVQSKLAEQLKNYLDTLRQNANNDTELLGELASAYEQLARLQGDPYYQNMGNVEASLDSYKIAHQLRKKLSATFPDAETAQVQLAESYSNLGAAYFISGETDSALEAHQSGLDILTKMRTSNLPVIATAMVSIRVCGYWGSPLEPRQH